MPRLSLMSIIERLQETVGFASAFATPDDTGIRFVNKRNKSYVFNVYITREGRISRIEIPRHVHVRFPYRVGDRISRNIETWACNNGYYINGKDTCPEEKVFGIRKSDIPRGHELRMWYPSKFSDD